MYLHDAARTALTPEAVAPPGRMAWEFSLADARACTPPVIADGKVFFGCSDHHVYALDALSGQPLWKFRTGADVLSVPAVWKGMVVFGSNDRNVYGVDAATGKQKWKIELPSSVVSAPCIVDGVAYVGSQDHRLLAIEVDSGKTLWTFATGGNIVGAPAVKGGIIYVGSRDHNLYALDQKTGLQRWTAKLSGDVLSTVSVHGAQVFGVDPVRGTVRLRTQDGKMAPATERFDTFLLPPGDDERVALVEPRGLKLMVVQSGSTSRLTDAQTGEVTADPIVAGDVLCFARGEVVYGFSVTQRKFVWRVGAPDVVTALAAANGTLYFATAAPSVGAFVVGSGRSSSVGANRPPKAIIEAFPQKVNKREPVTFDGSASFDPDGDPITLQWFGDVGIPQRELRGGFVTAYTKSGIFEVRLRVTDIHGAASEASALVQVNNRRPVAKIAGGNNYIDRQPVTLDGRGSRDPDGDRLVKFTWWEVLGNNVTVTRFFGAGTHSIRLIVKCEAESSGTDFGMIEIVFALPSQQGNRPTSPGQGGTTGGGTTTGGGRGGQ
jgi:outer membrane protein assembly factor BamB